MDQTADIGLSQIVWVIPLSDMCRYFKLYRLHLCIFDPYSSLIYAYVCALILYPSVTSEPDRY